MPPSAEAQRLATFLMMFKNRVNRSYEALANRAGISRSSLHRYCIGASVPIDYGAIQTFARDCGATPPELRELHRLWTLADANRKVVEPVRIEPPATGPRLAQVLASAAALLVIMGGTAWKVVSVKQRQQV